MSSTTCAQLTEEQQKFLDSMEEEFKHRYTEKDEEFKATLEEVLPLPPLLENWREFRPWDERNRGGYDRERGGYDRDRSGYDRDRRGYDRDRSGYDRDRGYGRNHNSYNDRYTYRARDSYRYGYHDQAS